MHIVLLKFAKNKADAPMYMQAHNAWLQQGFANGIFLLAGSIVPGQGGSILANGISESELRALVDQDPFVQEGVVSCEIIEIAPARMDERLAFLA